MSGAMRLSDAALSQAGRKLVEAAAGMLNGGAKRPAVISTISGAGGEVSLYLRGFPVARAALADAAKSSSVAVSAVMEESAALDTAIASALPAGFTRGEGGR